MPNQDFNICNDVQRATISGSGVEFGGTAPWNLHTDGVSGPILAPVTVGQDGAFSVAFSAQQTAILIADVDTQYRIIDSVPHPNATYVLDGWIHAVPC